MRLTIKESNMDYNEFQKTYKYALKEYPDVSYLYDNDKFSAEMEVTNYKKYGSKWVEDEKETETINWESYMNTIDATPFFKNLGGKERVIVSYTKWGRIPVEIQSTSPDRTEKTVRRFKFNRA